MAFWHQIASAHPNFRLDPNATCGQPDTIGAAGEGCIRFVHLRSTGDIGPCCQVTLPLYLGAFASALMAIWLSQWLMRPIRAVSRGLKSLAVGQLGMRMLGQLRTTNGEIQELGRDFDHAAACLQALSDGRTQLFHDIAHEIRSPLARLRAAVGLIKKNPAHGATLAGRMESDIARLDHLVDEILTLARFEKGERLSPFQRIDLLDLVENIIADAKFEGRARDVDGRYAGADVLELQCNPELLHRACGKVIRNALIHSSQGGTVPETEGIKDEAITLDIADDGPGVPASELDAIFGPFVRLHAETETSSAGLGLAIAYGAIHAHGGTITARNDDGGGLRPEILIPTGTSSAKPS